MRYWALFCIICVGACTGVNPAPSANIDPAEERRIVSLDFCADQYVLKLADRTDIRALSPDAIRDFSYMRTEAEGLPRVRPIAEEVLALKPSLIVRSYGGGPQAEAFYEGLGIPVLTVGWAGDMNSIKGVTRQMAEGLGTSERGAALITEIETRLDKLQPIPTTDEVLYVTTSGFTTGPGSLVNEMIEAAGLSNFETRPGWHALPLERLVHEEPDLVAPAFFDTNNDFTSSWSAARHPIARQQLSKHPSVALPGAWTACGAWFVLDAAEALANAPEESGTYE